jgi:translocator protein
MSLLLSGSVFALVSLVCAFFIVAHAFGRSVGTGVMVLCIPCFVVYYAFSQFEHRLKSWIVGTWLASVMLAAVFIAVGTRLLIQVMNSAPVGG